MSTEQTLAPMPHPGKLRKFVNRTRSEKPDKGTKECVCGTIRAENSIFCPAPP